MKYLILASLFISGLLSSAQAFSQTSVDCKVTSAYEIRASFDAAKNTLTYTSNQNGVSTLGMGISFDQMNKSTLNKDQSIVDLANAANVTLSSVNSANIFILSSSVEIVNFIDADGESVGVASIISGLNLRCQ